jgi:hydroxyethylthiazole kinase
MRAPDLAQVGELPELTADILARLRACAPRVHCITNAVAQTFTANMLLAAGAVPSMTIAPDEIGSFVGRADGLLVNLGTFDPERRDAVDIAISAAGNRIPWVLDPVFIDRAPARAAYARMLVAKAPRAIRLNAAEFTALSGVEPSVDAVAGYAREHHTVAGLTGATDFVTDGGRRVHISNGHPLMGRVTAMGCAASALVAACLAVEADPWRATAAGLLLLGVAGEVAAVRARGPGSLAVEIIDALHNLDRAAVCEQGRAG